MKIQFIQILQISLYNMASAPATLIGIILILLCRISPSSAQGGAGNPNRIIIAFAVVGSVVGLLVFIAIGIFSYKFAKKVVPDVIKEWRNPSIPAPASDLVVDTPEMEKFLREIADESPIRFTAQQLNAFTSNYSTRLGSGGFGDVYEGELPNGLKIAVKILKRSNDKKSENQFMAEIGTIGRTRHRNLLRLYGFCYDEFTSALVLEFMENGSLDRILYGKTRSEIHWKKFQEIAIGIAKGIAYMHEESQRKMIHYDIKPANILLDADFSPRIGDFGLANLCNKDETHESVKEYRGTPGYSAPELVRMNFPVSSKCDVYSFGMVLFEIVGRRKNAAVSPAGSIDWFPIQVWERFEEGELMNLSGDFDVEDDDDGERKMAVERMCLVALWCVQDSPEDRPPIRAVVAMLEGNVEIMPPPKPFQYMFPISTDTSAVTVAIDSDQMSSGSTSGYSLSKGSLPIWYKNSAPILET